MYSIYSVEVTPCPEAMISWCSLVPLLSMIRSHPWALIIPEKIITAHDCQEKLNGCVYSTVRLPVCVCVSVCVLCVCELLLWVRLGGSSPGSFALIRSATGQLSLTPSMTKTQHEKWRVCPREKEPAGGTYTLPAAWAQQCRVRSMKWELCVWPSNRFPNYFS